MRGGGWVAGSVDGGEALTCAAELSSGSLGSVECWGAAELDPGKPNEGSDALGSAEECRECVFQGVAPRVKNGREHGHSREFYSTGDNPPADHN